MKQLMAILTTSQFLLSIGFDSPRFFFIYLGNGMSIELESPSNVRLLDMLKKLVKNHKILNT